MIKLKVGALVLSSYAQITFSTPLNLPGSSDPFVSVGAETVCRDRASVLGETTASCNQDNSRAHIDLSKAELRVYASGTGEPDYIETQAGYVDQITVTGGWNEEGKLKVEFELLVQGEFDTSNNDKQAEANFLVATWAGNESTPTCIHDADDCGFFNGPYNYAELYFDLFDGDLSADVYQAGSGATNIFSTSSSNLQGSLSVEIDLTQEQPSFFIAAMGTVGVFEEGVSDFYNTARASLRGPDGFEFVSSNGFGSALSDPAPPNSPSGSVTIGGNIETSGGDDICAMVLASGQHMFTCNPVGTFSLTDLPREEDGSVKLQVYADGFFTHVETLEDSATKTIAMTRAGDCPNYNLPEDAQSYPDSKGKQHSISGRVLLGATDTPVCAMVLANGEHVFSCDGSGSFSLSFPLNANGQYKLQVFADGFAPSIQTFDEFGDPGQVRMAKSFECE